MRLQTIKLADLRPYKNNPRKNDGAVDAVAESIRQCGYVAPIIVDENMEILAGHTRYKALKKLKYQEADVLVKSSLTEEQKRKYRLLDNKTNELAEWDFDLLAEEMQGLDFEELDLDWGIGEEEKPEAFEDNFEIKLPEAPKAKLGQIYRLGRPRLMCGNSIDESDVKNLTNEEPIHLVYTDPPYGMNAVSKSGVLSQKYKTDIIGDDDNKAAIESFSLCQKMYKNSNQVWWGANYYTECLPSSECWIVWDKNNGSSDQTDCELAWTNFRSVVRQFTMASEKKNRVHPTQKPCRLLCEIIERFDKNNTFKTVLDLFGGSGSTLIACEQLNRTCYMMELDPKYVDVIIDRWEQFTGEKAVLLNG